MSSQLSIGQHMNVKKGTPEILKGKIPRDHTGPRIVPIPSGKPKIYRGLGRLLKRVLPQKWKKNSTRLHNTLISPNYT